MNCDHDWPAIDAAMERAGWPKTNTDTANGVTTRREGED